MNMRIMNISLFTKNLKIGVDKTSTPNKKDKKKGEVQVMRGLNELRKLRKELKEVERRRFFNMRVDRWTDENRMIDYECSVKIGKLEEKISRLEKICQNNSNGNECSS